MLEVVLLLVLFEWQYPYGGECGSSVNLVCGDNMKNELLEFLCGIWNKGRGKKIILFYYRMSEHSCVYVLCKYLLYFRRFVSLVRMPRFSPWVVRVGFEVKRVTVGRLHCRQCGFPLPLIIPPILRARLWSGAGTVGRITHLCPTAAATTTVHLCNLLETREIGDYEYLLFFCTSLCHSYCSSS